MSSNELQEPLTGGGAASDNDAGSQRSSSGASLLERIRAQRAQQEQQDTAAPTTIQVPQYNPVAQQENFAGGGPAAAAESSGTGTSNFFSSAWNNISESMETGMASLQQEGYESSDQALLPPSAMYGEGGVEEDYSMTNYFMTFVNDVYKSFLGLPLLVRLTMIFALLFTAFKLM